MKVDIVNQETIKPSFPTPSHLRTHNISALDQVANPIYTSHILMYPAAATSTTTTSPEDAARRYDHFSQTLKNSLSDTLTVFPPLAGRFKDNVSVACNDHGVSWYEARVRCTMDRLLLDVHSESLESLVAGGDIDACNVLTGAQLLVQINLFDCGGIALGLSFSHKTCDLVNDAMFIKSWSARAINSSSPVVVPDFTVAEKIPPRKHVSVHEKHEFQPEAINQELSAVRLVFDGPELAALKAKSASQGTPQPTRVEAVTALIVKCAVTASITNNNKRDPMYSYLFTNMVNMRKKLLLPETTFGNVVGGYTIAASSCPDPSLDILVDKLRKGRMEYYDSLAANGGKVIQDFIETVEGAAPGDTEMYLFTSWCRFGFYQVDFGLGKPKWVGRPLTSMKNFVHLMDADGCNNRVEAHITLTKQDMDLFRVDPILLEYASVRHHLVIRGCSTRFFDGRF